MGRHANGEGSIYRRKDGRYEAAAYLLTTSGTRKRVRVYGRTRAAVHDKLTEAKAKVQAGTPIPDRQVRLGEYLDYWLEHVVRPNKRPATYDQCEMIVRLYLKPGLGKSSLNQLSVPVTQAFLNQKIGDGHSIPKVQVMRKVLSAALTCAMRDELVSRNVARLAILPKHEPAEVQPWSADETKRFLDAAKTHPLYAAFALLVLYGLRRGEVLGLQWQDVDFEYGVIRIRQQLQRGDRELQLGPLKTRAGRRDLPMLGIVRKVLMKYRTNQGIAASGGLVFTTMDGRPMEASTLVRSFQRVCRDYDIRLIRVHDIRHTTATLLKNLGVPARDAQLILGHANIATTQQIYQHDDLSSRLEALGKVEKLFMRTVGSASVRCRQFSRQGWYWDALFITVNCGAGDGTLTRGLILGKSGRVTINDRITEVVSAVKRAQRQWLVGVVAVNFAVKVLVSSGQLSPDLQ